MGSLEQVLIKFSKIAKDLDIEYVIVGGIAVLFHGIVRATTDIDCIIDADEAQIRAFAKRIGAAGFYVDEEDLLSMMKGEGHASIEEKGSMLRLDLFSPKDRLANITLDESTVIDLDGTKLRIASPETMIVSKLRFGSPQDLRDAEGIYGRHHDELDLKKLERFARLVGMERKLAALRKRLDKELK